MKFARALGIDILVFQYAILSFQLLTYNSPGSTGCKGDKQVMALDRLASDIKLLLDQVPNITLAIENSVSSAGLLSLTPRLTDVEVN
jgi:hypothetical protein